MENYEKLRKWRHYATHAKKFRTRKKYKRKLEKHFRLVLRWYAPPKIYAPVANSAFGCWWARTPYSRCCNDGFLLSETELAGMKMREEAAKRGV